ncbi:MAG: hypothetical protein J0J01_19340 [Reyranella sp.]|uniref:hypothetical protein n=1 Tax=Reyranella sp. TaxID=1929291 RepID=UPI001ACBC4F0|nr:hypothetical protein [Reyranella sp.]MBN9089068.1 hypothetical protein [Reyranella sp.]
MTVPFRTFALFGAALGMLAAGYLLAPAPGASRSLAAPATKVVPPAAPKPETTLVAGRPPVPLMTPARQTATVERTIDSSSSDKPTVDLGTSSTNPPDPNDPKDDGKARQAIEFDGYKNVRGLVKGPDGSWRGRAMRGRTEIAVRVDASGSVSAE